MIINYWFKVIQTLIVQSFVLLQRTHQTTSDILPWKKSFEGLCIKKLHWLYNLLCFVSIMNSQLCLLNLLNGCALFWSDSTILATIKGASCAILLSWLHISTLWAKNSCSAGQSDSWNAELFPSRFNKKVWASRVQFPDGICTRWTTPQVLPSAQKLNSLRVMSSTTVYVHSIEQKCWRMFTIAWITTLGLTHCDLRSPQQNICKSIGCWQTWGYKHYKNITQTNTSHNLFCPQVMCLENNYII